MKVTQLLVNVKIVKIKNFNDGLHKTKVLNCKS